MLNDEGSNRTFKISRNNDENFLSYNVLLVSAISYRMVLSGSRLL